MPVENERGEEDLDIHMNSVEWDAESAVRISCSTAEEEDEAAEGGTGDRKATRKNKKRRNKRNEEEEKVDESEN